MSRLASESALVAHTGEEALSALWNTVSTWPAGRFGSVRR